MTVSLHSQYDCPEVKNIMKAHHIEPLPPTTNQEWNDVARIALVVRMSKIDYAKFRDDYHIINHIPTRLNPARPKSFCKLIENCKISMRCGLITPIDNFESAFVEGYRLGNIGELWRFLNWENQGIWKINHCNGIPKKLIHKSTGNYWLINI